MRSLLLAGTLIALGLLLQALDGAAPLDAPPVHPATHAAPASAPVPVWRG